MVLIYDYLEYRTFLKDAFAEKKAVNHHFTYRYLAMKLNLKSSGFLLYVLQGKRNLSEELALSCCELLKLKEAEKEYLLQLLRYNHAKSPKEKQFHFEQLFQFKHSSAKKTSPKQYLFYEKWYYSVIRELISHRKYSSDDAAEIAQTLQPPISTSNVKEALKILEQLELIQKDKHGVYYRSDSIISTGDTWESAVIHGLQIQFAQLGKEALDRFEKKQRNFSNLTLSISDQSLALIYDRIASLRKEILEIACADQNADKVFQCNFQLFPLTQIYKEAHNG